VTYYLRVYTSPWVFVIYFSFPPTYHIRCFINLFKTSSIISLFTIKSIIEVWLLLLLLFIFSCYKISIWFFIIFILFFIYFSKTFYIYIHFKSVYHYLLKHFLSSLKSLANNFNVCVISILARVFFFQFKLRVFSILYVSSNFGFHSTHFDVMLWNSGSCCYFCFVINQYFCLVNKLTQLGSGHTFQPDSEFWFLYNFSFQTIVVPFWFVLCVQNQVWDLDNVLVSS
jgi:hypothetical protein